MKRAAEFYVVLTDVVASRQIGDRQTFNLLFEQALEKINRELASHLELPMQGWKGLDEMAALIKSPVCLYKLIDMLNTMLAPQQTRLVVVKGEVDVAAGSGNITRADGPAFHQAAALMQELKKDGLLLSCKTGDAETDRLLQLNINALQLLKSGWTSRQRLVYDAYKASGNQEAVATALGITQQTVSKTLKAINAAQVQLLENSLQQWLETQYR